MSYRSLLCFVRGRGKSALLVRRVWSVLLIRRSAVVREKLNPTSVLLESISFELISHKASPTIVLAKVSSANTSKREVIPGATPIVSGWMRVEHLL